MIDKDTHRGGNHRMMLKGGGSPKTKAPPCWHSSSWAYLINITGAVYCRRWRAGTWIIAIELSWSDFAWSGSLYFVSIIVGGRGLLLKDWTSPQGHGRSSRSTTELVSSALCCPNLSRSLSLSDNPSLPSPHISPETGRINALIDAVDTLQISPPDPEPLGSLGTCWGD